jgi:digalactosyldiacylglycerol synthase
MHLPFVFFIIRYHYGPRWGDRFAHVAGIGHTNYLEYCRSDKKQIGWRLKEPVTRVMTTVVTTAYCDVVVQVV